MRLPSGQPCVAERHAAVHAAAAPAGATLLGRCGRSNSRESPQPLARRSRLRRRLARPLHEAGRLAHRLSPPPPTISGSRGVAAVARRARPPRLQHALVVGRHHLHELRHQVLPVVEDAAAPAGCRCGARGSRSGRRPARSRDSSTSDSSSTISRLQRSRNAALAVEHVGDAAAHAGGEVAAGRAEHHHHAAGHVLAAVVADALDDRVRAAVAHREALAGEAARRRLARGGAVEHGVADDDVLLGRRSARPRGG